VNADKLTTALGLALGLLHQYAVVGLIPQDVTGWAQTAASLAIAVFAYYTNKK
jgi:hypothetical protein